MYRKLFEIKNDQICEFGLKNLCINAYVHFSVISKNKNNNSSSGRKVNTSKQAAHQIHFSSCQMQN